MAADSRVSIFTTAMKSQFINAYMATAAPAPWEQITEVIPSDARIEHYTWMSPTPGLSRYVGHRRYGKVSTIRYSVENLEFDSSFEVLLRDVEDDQVGGYKRKPAELAERAKKFPGRWALQHLAAGESRACFDGSSFHANSHTIGTGDNLLTGTGTLNSDGFTYKMIAMYTGGGLKPLLWQQRKSPNFQTNAGSPQSYESKVLRYFIDLEGEAAYGYWWDSVLFKWTSQPTVTEVHTAFAQIQAAFRTFLLPKALDSDDGERIHEQEVFSSANMVYVVSTALEETMNQALNQSWVPQTIGSTTVPTTNRFLGKGAIMVSAFLDP